MSNNGSPPPASPSGAGSVRLSANEPIVVLVVAQEPGDDVVIVDVVSIRNPGLQGVQVDVALVFVVEGQRVAEAIGTITPFPADQASAHVLRLTDEASTLLADADGGAGVELRLRPADRTLPLSPDIALTVDVELSNAESLQGTR